MAENSARTSRVIITRIKPITSSTQKILSHRGSNEANVHVTRRKSSTDAKTSHTRRSDSIGQVSKILRQRQSVPHVTVTKGVKIRSTTFQSKNVSNMENIKRQSEDKNHSIDDIDLNSVNNSIPNNYSKPLNLVQDKQTSINNEQLRKPSILSASSSLRLVPSASVDHHKSKVGKSKLYKDISFQMKSSSKRSKSRNDFIEENERRQRQRTRRCFGYFPCSPLCATLSILGIILLLSGIAGLIVGLLNHNAQKNTPSISTTNSSVNNSTTTTTINPSSTLATATNITTTDSTTFSNIDSTTITDTTTDSTTETTSITGAIDTITTTTITASTSTKTTSTTSTATTTTLPVCNHTCVNQTWLSKVPLFAKWRFENNYLDENKIYNGTPSGSPTFVQGYAGKAISFAAGSSQMVSTAYIPLANTSFSVDAWIYPTGLSNVWHQCICGLCPSASSDNCFHTTLRKTSSAYPLYFGFFNDDVNSNTPPISVNKWVHAAFTFQVSALKVSIYLNGILLANGITNSALKATSGNFLIGNIPLLVTSIDTFQGYIDELTLGNGVMSTCEILEKATLAASFSFDGGSPLSDLGPNSVSSSGSNYSLVSGRSLQAISFTGSSSSFFQASGFLALGVDGQPFSFSFWVQPQSLAGTLVHVSSNATGAGSCAPFIGFASNGSLIAQVKTNTSYVAVSYSSLSLFSFSHIVQTWSSTNGLRLYVNSVLVSSAPATSYLASSVWINYVTLGGCLSGCVSCSALAGNRISAGPFAGAVDSFQIYSRELTSDDVCTLFIYS